ncbi:MAG: c-type cytochrome [Limnohabitans sp.]
MSDHHQANDLLGLIKQHPKHALVAALVAVAALVLAIVASSKPASTASFSPEAVAGRIQKVGAVEIRDANRAARSGEQVFKAQCTNCHTAGVVGAPKFGDAGAWGPRIAKGYEALLTSALKGKGAMGPQGGGDFADFEIGRGVAYMANAAGGKFAEPKDPNAK